MDKARALANPVPTAARSRPDLIDGIVTPEAVVLDLDTAGLASRVAAGLVDLVIIVVGLSVLGAVIESTIDDSSGATIAAVMFFLALFGYPIAFESLMGGRTPGKAMLGLRVVAASGAPVRWPEVVLRAMGGVVDKLAPPGGITGALFVMWTPRHQRVGDLLAGTIVINDPAMHRAAPALWFSPPYGLEDYAEQIDPTAITPEQYTVVRAFLTRAGSMAPGVRAHVAAQLAAQLGAVVRHTPPPQVSAESFLLCAMARYQRRTVRDPSVR